MRDWLNGFIMGNISMVTLLLVVYLTSPMHMRQLDEYPVDPNKDSIETSPTSGIPLNALPPPTE